MSSNVQITERMEVVGVDGHHIGEVDKVRGEDFELTQFDFGAGLRRHKIPRSWIQHVDEKVHLNMTHDQAKASWSKAN